MLSSTSGRIVLDSVFSLIWSEGRSSFDSGKLFVIFLQFILFSGAVRCERTRHQDVVRQFPEQTSSVQYACTQIAVFMRGSGSDWSADAFRLSEVES